MAVHNGSAGSMFWPDHTVKARRLVHQGEAERKLNKQFLLLKYIYTGERVEVAYLKMLFVCFSVFLQSVSW